MAPDAEPLPVIPGLSILSLDDDHWIEVINPDTTEGQPYYLSVRDRVEGQLVFPDMDIQSRAEPLAALEAELVERYGAGVMVSGVGSPEAPDNLFVGHFRWTLTR